MRMLEATKEGNAKTATCDRIENCPTLAETGAELTVASAF